MNRRQFLKTTAAAALAALDRSQAALAPAKITRVRIYQPPNWNQLFNQSNMICTIETDAGIMGIGEGGFAVVWRGFHLELQRPVAVKVPKRVAAAGDGPDPFLAEARRASRLDPMRVLRNS